MSHLKAIRPGLLAGGLVLLAGAVAGAAAPIPVVVSVPPQAEIVERLGGEAVAVTVLVPPGMAPDSFEPRPGAIRALRAARLYLRIGHPAFLFERRQLLPAAGGSSLEVVDMVRQVALLAAPGGHGHGPGHGDGAADTDPHVWLAPEAVIGTAREVVAALCRLEPASCRRFEANLATFLDDVAALDAEIRGLLAAAAGRRFYVYHPAWGYFARQYGLEQVAIELEGKEPGPASLRRLIERARRDGVGTIFVERAVAGRSAAVIAAEIGAEVAVLDPLARDWMANLRIAARAIAGALR